jgi:hypothetical protein
MGVDTYPILASAVVAGHVFWLIQLFYRAA